MLKFMLLFIFGIIESLIIGFLIPAIQNKKFETKNYFLFCTCLTILIFTTKQLPMHALVAMLFNMCVFIFLCSYFYKLSFIKSALTVIILMITLLISELLSEIVFNHLPLECVLDLCIVPQNKLIYSYIVAHSIYAFLGMIIYIISRIFWRKKSIFISKAN
ncbi:hypothetical protein Clocel_1242 [Clostridium cellulovorans 743B]|uniref:Uncharacterized protein n=1 Tax=Clostridium cellulovorans (strain ATCC 35296 / DSM 3052 / OCM 3 / 743B) TaxID=573061 RepID=D9SUU2_CLOC7|nr:hypothetical protein Clocel_1242 [Clostridium cellulovorans 743B]